MHAVMLKLSEDVNTSITHYWTCPQSLTHTSSSFTRQNALSLVLPIQFSTFIAVIDRPELGAHCAQVSLLTALLPVFHPQGLGTGADTEINCLQLH